MLFKSQSKVCPDPYPKVWFANAPDASVARIFQPNDPANDPANDSPNDPANDPGGIWAAFDWLHFDEGSATTMSVHEIINKAITPIANQPEQDVFTCENDACFYYSIETPPTPEGI